MACKKYRENLILYLYGELDQAGRESVENHVAGCAACRQELEYTRRVMSALDTAQPSEIPEGNWDKYWGEIQGHIKTPARKARFWFPLGTLPRWSYAAAALVFVFMLGLFVGRVWFLPGLDGDKKSDRDKSSVILALNEHLDELKPYMIEFSNVGEGQNGRDLITVDRSALKMLMVQNVLLKKALTEKDPGAAELLDDIELVLAELINMDEGDERTPALVKELIKKREILFKMNVLHKM